MSRRSCY